MISGIKNNFVILILFTISIIPINANNSCSKIANLAYQ